MPQDLPTTAAANSTRLRNNAEAVISAGPPRLAEFHAVAAKASAGSAVLPFKLDLIDAACGIISRRGMVAADQGLKDPIDVEHAFAATQRAAWYAARLAFEDHWQGGRQFVYTALILEGLAPPGYGPYTLVVDDPPGCQGCFPGNTAERYAHGGTLDVMLCESEAAPWANRGDLLTVKHSTGVPVARSSWPTLVLSNTVFSEALWMSPITLDRVSEVRVKDKDYKRWRRLHRDFHNKVALNVDDQLSVAALQVLNSWRSRYGTRIVEV